MIFRSSVYAILLALVPFPAFAALPGETASAMESIGIPVYPDAVYCIGDQLTGVRFATRDTPEKVQAWYRERLADWTLFDRFGMWALVNAPSVNGLDDIMGNNHVAVSFNADLPEWHRLAADMTTDITVNVPKVRPATPGGALLTVPPGEMPPHNEAIHGSAPFEVTGSLGSGEDVEFGLGRYFYIQDEEHGEYPVVYKFGMPDKLSNRLYTIGTVYEKVRVKGYLVTLQDGRPLGFDRARPIEIFEVE